MNFTRKFRLLYGNICTSNSFKGLDSDAALLWTWLITQTDDEGCTYSDLEFLKGHVVPFLPQFTRKIIANSLSRLEKRHLLHLYTNAKGEKILQISRTNPHQNIRQDKIKKSEFGLDTIKHCEECCPPQCHAKKQTPDGLETDYKQIADGLQTDSKQIVDRPTMTQVLNTKETQVLNIDTRSSSIQDTRDPRVVTTEPPSTRAQGANTPLIRVLRAYESAFGGLPSPADEQRLLRWLSHAQLGERYVLQAIEDARPQHPNRPMAWLTTVLTSWIAEGRPLTRTEQQAATTAIAIANLEARDAAQKAEVPHANPR